MNNLCAVIGTMKRFYLTTALALTIFVSFSQSPQNEEDSSRTKQLEEVVVTATRTERKLSNVAVPVQIITNKAIQQSGSLRLNDILGEQTGLFITSSGATTSAGGGVFGNGVQIQGLAPNHVLILLNGEPVIGRNGGIIDLTRLATGDIKKIEVVKGPSSSLYGSEAMGGVVNIITEQPQQDKLIASLRYGRFNSTDANLTTAIKRNKWGLQLFGNRNSSDGFDFDKTTPEKTVDPFKNYTGQIHFNFLPAAKTKITLLGRYYNEIQDNFFMARDISTGNDINITGDGRIRDLNINPTVTQRFNNRSQSSLRLNFSRYEYEQQLNKQSDKSLYYHDFFQQDFYRVENQTDIRLTDQNYFVGGGGIIWQRLNTTRYSGVKHSNQYYLFLQDEHHFTDKLLAIAGLRFDKNSDYKEAWSPKLAAQYKFSDKFRINASYGGGFKAPDFQQLYLNFLNTAAGGYVVYGANEITITALEKQKQEGVISEILPKAYQLALLKPEVSRGLNAGAHYEASDKLHFALNLFRNDIDNLIQVDIVAYRSNNAPVYSYFNVKKAFTQGAEFEAKYSLNSYWQLQGGYQFLMTADKADLKKIKQGIVFTRDIQSGNVTRVSRRDYGGLPNRSAHMVNAKLFYDNPTTSWSGSLRVIYRSRWGTYDKDGNDIINRSDEFAKGFASVNIAAAKTINHFKIQAGIDNVFNYKDELNLPTQPGIQPYVSLAYSFINNHK